MNGEENNITVFIIAASQITRAGLEAVLEIDERLIITGSAAEISAALFDFSSVQTVNILLVHVERRNQLDALTEFLIDEDAEEKSPAVVALISAEFQNSEQVIGLLQNGARGILPNDASADEISAAIGAAANNLFVAPPDVLETLFSSISAEDFSLSAEKNILDEMPESLTAREREVLEFLVEGESNKIIAHLLNISEHTVKFHVASIFGKLGVNSHTEAVTQALRRGLVLL
jgi:NarL family two-component system response regulator YdfI